MSPRSLSLVAIAGMLSLAGCGKMDEPAGSRRRTRPRLWRSPASRKRPRASSLVKRKTSPNTAAIAGSGGSGSRSCKEA